MKLLCVDVFDSGHDPIVDIVLSVVNALYVAKDDEQGTLIISPDVEQELRDHMASHELGHHVYEVHTTQPDSLVVF